MTLPLEGILAGTAHVLTGPDHLVGVAPMAVGCSARTRPWAVGASWGVGHGLGVAFLGVLGQTFLSAADIEVASAWSERLVGIVLVVLGILAMRRAGEPVIHGHGPRSERHGRTAFGVGVVHGLAGAGHFWAVLPSLAMGPEEAAIYITGYVLASITAMVAFGAILGRLVRTVGMTWLPTFLRIVGATTISVGIWWFARAF